MLSAHARWSLLYMKELEPGGRYTKTRFTKEQAEETLDKLIGELEAIDPETTKDRWVNVHGGKTFREHWQEGGLSRSLPLDALSSVGCRPQDHAPSDKLRA